MRIRNVVEDETLSTGVRLGWLALCGVMIGLAVVVLWGALSSISDGANVKNHQIWVGCVYGLAAITLAVWIVQIVDIVTEWRSLGFVVVHLVLAAVSIGLASWAVRDVRSDQRP